MPQAMGQEMSLGAQLSLQCHIVAIRAWKYGDINGILLSDYMPQRQKSDIA